MVSCDFCGRSELELQRPDRNSLNKIETDEDGLWICSDCQTKTVSMPSGIVEEDEHDQRIRTLIGKSAGSICLTMNLPYEPPYENIIDAASKIAYDEDRYMSTWSYLAQWIDGTTVWLSPDKNTKALVLPNGDIEFRVKG